MPRHQLCIWQITMPSVWRWSSEQIEMPENVWRRLSPQLRFPNKAKGWCFRFWWWLCFHCQRLRRKQFLNFQYRIISHTHSRCTHERILIKKLTVQRSTNTSFPTPTYLFPYSFGIHHVVFYSKSQHSLLMKYFPNAFYILDGTWIVGNVKKLHTILLSAHFRPGINRTFCPNSIQNQN